MPEPEIAQLQADIAGLRDRIGSNESLMQLVELVQQLATYLVSLDDEVGELESRARFLEQPQD